ncbi:FGGY-family carbohydrate kinase [Antribacter gilvus]|uniref:FGGY-family carbohydrate kinase n=1 Tax=Antribacter gilvus TaxID=2304675 RepID=UPI000F794BB9|nr:FGGY family carbohydrate kinase [Antribacter gilvus]
MSQQCTLGVDIGTSSSKGVLVAADGTVLGTATRQHRVERPRTGHVEMDPRIWWQEFVELSRELLDGARRAGHDVVVRAVGVSGMGPCVALADAHLDPVRPAILYGVDTRATEQITRLTVELGPAAIVARGGSALTTQAAGPKIVWVAEHEPEAAARARRLYMPASWLVAHLTGEYVLDHHSASQCNPLYDLEAREWYAPWCEQYAPGLELPRLLWAGDVAGTVTAEAGLATGIPEGVPVITGTIDAWAEAVSVGAHDVGDLMVMYGTTMFLVATTDRLVRTPSMWTTVGALAGRTCLAGGMATSGAITTWIRDLVSGGAAAPGYPELLAEAAASGLGSRGLLMLPYFAGERTPVQDPDARGVVVGLTLEHGRGDLYRSALEATAFGVRHNLETLRAAGAQIDRVVAVGGGTAGDLWTQIVSDVTGLAQEIPATTIGASYGVAFLAASAVAEPGAQPSMAAWNPVAERREPDAAAHARYSRIYTQYRALYEATADVVHAVVDLARDEAAAHAAAAPAPATGEAA